MTSSLKETKPKEEFGNLKSIVSELDAREGGASVRSASEAVRSSVVPESNNKERPVSASPPSESARSDALRSQQRPFSMNDLTTIDPKLSVRSAGLQSFGGSTFTGLSKDLNASQNLAVSVPNLPYTSKNTPKFKRITIVLSPNFTGFGFTINSQIKPKYMIFDVDQGSPAEAAGLEKNDVLVEVNGKNIRRSSFDKVRATLAQASQNGKVEILVISKEGYLWFKERKKRFSMKLANDKNVELYSNLNLNDLDNRPTSARSVDYDTRRSRDPQHIYTNDTVVDEEPQKLQLQQQLQGSAPPEFDASQAENEIIHCTMRRIEGFSGFGMSISTSNNPNGSARIPVPVVTRVEPGSPAEKAGLKENDQIVEINGKATYQQNSDFIANSIRNSREEVDLVLSREKLPVGSVVVNEVEPNIIKSEMSMSSSKIHLSTTPTPEVARREPEPKPIQKEAQAQAPVPRLCRIRSSYDTNLGFAVSPSQVYPGLFKVIDVTQNSPSYNSGLRSDDFIVEISGTNVESMSYDEVVNLIKIKKDDDDLQLLVADRSTLEWYGDKNEPIASRVLPKLTYIETLLKDEMQYTLTDANNSVHKISQESLNTLERNS